VKMRSGTVRILMVAVVMVAVGMVSSLSSQAGGPPLKEKPCGVCHQDFQKILPQTHPAIGDAAKNPCFTCHKPDPDRSEATKFSTFIHTTHKEGGKTTLPCQACHAL